MVISSLSTILCLGVAFLAVRVDHRLMSWPGLLPPALLIGTVPFAIRGYTITPNAILVHRLFWTTRLPLAGIASARFDPDAMRGSIRTFGNGGMFSFTGFYRNARLGAFRAFVTDQHKTIVLRYPNRTVVISPGEPEDFIRHLAILGHAGQTIMQG